MMKTARFTESQVVTILKLADSGMKGEKPVTRTELVILRTANVKVVPSGNFYRVYSRYSRYSWTSQKLTAGAAADEMDILFVCIDFICTTDSVLVFLTPE